MGFDFFLMVLGSGSELNFAETPKLYKILFIFLKGYKTDFRLNFCW